MTSLTNESTAQTETTTITTETTTITETTTTDTTTEKIYSNLINEVRQLMQNYQEPDLLEKRALAGTMAVQAILADHVNQIKEQASRNRTSALIYEFLHSDRVQFNDCYLRDMLGRGNLPEILQDHLNSLHGPDHFLIYYTVTRPLQVPNAILSFDPRYKIYVSWKPEEFERLRELNLETGKTIKYISNMQSSYRQQALHNEASDRHSTPEQTERGRPNNGRVNHSNHVNAGPHDRTDRTERAERADRVDRLDQTNRVDQTSRAERDTRPRGRRVEQPVQILPRQPRQPRRVHPGVTPHEDSQIEMAAQQGTAPVPLRVPAPTWGPKKTVVDDSSSSE